MEIGAILLLIALLAGVGLFLAAPLLRGARPQRLDESPEISSLLAEQDRILTSLQELDFDFKLGKIPEDAYPGQRTSLLLRGTEILRKLDELVPESAGAASASPSARIEAAVAGETGASLSDDKIETMLAARRSARRTKSAGFCPRCGKPALASDRFCPHCGMSLQ